MKSSSQRAIVQQQRFEVTWKRLRGIDLHPRIAVRAPPEQSQPLHELVAIVGGPFVLIEHSNPPLLAPPANDRQLDLPSWRLDGYESAFEFCRLEQPCQKLEQADIERLGVVQGDFR
jgi:hypothetical protein